MAIVTPEQHNRLYEYATRLDTRICVLEAKLRALAEVTKHHEAIIQDNDLDVGED